MPERPAELARLYDGLARYCWLRRVLRRAKAGEGLEMHKRLEAPLPGADRPAAGAAALNHWLLAQASGGPEGPLLDVGCGLGATVFAWARAHAGPCVGLSPSGFQIAKARAQAQRLGLAERCTFLRQSYDDALPGPFATLVSIESLFHAPDLGRTLRNLAAKALPEARLVLCEDMLMSGAARGADAHALLAHWATARLYGEDDYRAALAAAGFALLREIDLTDQVRAAAPAVLEARERRLALLARVVRSAQVRAVLAAYRGGVVLERLYAAGQMRYRALVAARRESPR